MILTCRRSCGARRKKPSVLSEFLPGVLFAVPRQLFPGVGGTDFMCVFLFGFCTSESQSQHPKPRQKAHRLKSVLLKPGPQLKRDRLRENCRPIEFGTKPIRSVAHQ